MLLVGLFPVGFLLVVVGEALRVKSVQATIARQSSYSVNLLNAGGLATMAVGVMVMISALLLLLVQTP